jgi:hypothetical protein
MMARTLTLLLVLASPLAHADEPATAPASTPATAPATSAAPTQDVVVLKDGSRLEGRVTAHVPGRYVTIVTARGEQTVTWDDVKRVILLKPLPPAPAPRATPTTPGGEQAAQGHGESKGDLSLRKGGFEYTKTLEAAEAKRQAWAKRGGSILSYELRGQATGFYIPKMKVLAMGMPSLGQLDPVAVEYEVDAGGVGGGVGGRISYLYLKLPDQTRRWSWLFMGRLATGVDFSAMSYRIPVGKTPTATTSLGYEYSSSGFISLQVPFVLSGSVGLGLSDGVGSWTGLVVSLGYAPSLSYSRATSGGGDGSFAFNPMGFEIAFDPTSLEAMIEKHAKKAHLRITAFVLPPVDPLNAWIITVGVGAIWY